MSDIWWHGTADGDETSFNNLSNWTYNQDGTGGNPSNFDSHVIHFNGTGTGCDRSCYISSDVSVAGIDFVGSLVNPTCVESSIFIYPASGYGSLVLEYGYVSGGVIFVMVQTYVTSQGPGYMPDIYLSAPLVIQGNVAIGKDCVRVISAMSVPLDVDGSWTVEVDEGYSSWIDVGMFVVDYTISGDGTVRVWGIDDIEPTYNLIGLINTNEVELYFTGSSVGAIWLPADANLSPNVYAFEFSAEYTGADVTIHINTSLTRGLSCYGAITVDAIGLTSINAPVLKVNSRYDGESSLTLSSGTVLVSLLELVKNQPCVVDMTGATISCGHLTANCTSWALTGSVNMLHTGGAGPTTFYLISYMATPPLLIDYNNNDKLNVQGTASGPFTFNGGSLEIVPATFTINGDFSYNSTDGGISASGSNIKRELVITGTGEVSTPVPLKGINFNCANGPVKCQKGGAYAPLFEKYVYGTDLPRFPSAA